MRWSSEPEASRRPDLDQLETVRDVVTLAGKTIPKSVYAAAMAFKFIDNIQVLHPLSVAVDAENARIPLAVSGNLPPQQAVVDGVLHLGTGVVIAELIEYRAEQCLHRWVVE